MADKIRLALVGQGISASLSPGMHMAEGRAQGVGISYGLIDTMTAAHRHRALGEIVATAAGQGLAGLNVTHPYKTAVLAHLDDLSDDARRLGAVNTIVFKDGRAVGHNTDFSGFAAGFAGELADAPREDVLLLGAGGAGAAVGFALIDAGVARLGIHDLDRQRAEALARALGQACPDTAVRVVERLNRQTTKGLRGLVNATPMGMARYPGSAFPCELLHRGLWVGDVVYFPSTTALLARARAVGCRVMPGAAMAIWQAVHGFELFTGRRADPARMRGFFSGFHGRDNPGDVCVGWVKPTLP